MAEEADDAFTTTAETAVGLGSASFVEGPYPMVCDGSNLAGSAIVRSPSDYRTVAMVVDVGNFAVVGNAAPRHHLERVSILCSVLQRLPSQTDYGPSTSVNPSVPTV